MLVMVNDSLHTTLGYNTWDTI